MSPVHQPNTPNRAVPWTLTVTISVATSALRKKTGARTGVEDGASVVTPTTAGWPELPGEDALDLITGVLSEHSSSRMNAVSENKAPGAAGDLMLG